MRKLKLQMQVTLDGYIAGLKGEMDWLCFGWDEEIKSYVGELTSSIDTILLGRKLAEGFIPHWAAKPEYESHEAIDIMNNTHKVVFTQTIEVSPWENTVLATGDLTTEVNALKARVGGDMIVYGGGIFVASLIEAGLIDELHLFVNPTAIGTGVSIFKSKQTMRLKQVKPFPCGIVLMCYEPIGK